LRRIIEQIRPDEVYNLAAQSHVRISFDQPGYRRRGCAGGLASVENASITPSSREDGAIVSGQFVRDVWKGSRGSPAGSHAFSFRGAHMPAPRCTHIDRRSTIAKPTTYLW
jgi:hypothetical protein